MEHFETFTISGKRLPKQPFSFNPKHQVSIGWTLECNKRASQQKEWAALTPPPPQQIPNIAFNIGRFFFSSAMASFPCSLSVTTAATGSNNIMASWPEKYRPQNGDSHQHIWSRFGFVDAFQLDPVSFAIPVGAKFPWSMISVLKFSQMVKY